MGERRESLARWAGLMGFVMAGAAAWASGFGRGRTLRGFLAGARGGVPGDLAAGRWSGSGPGKWMRKMRRVLARRG